MAKRDYYEVLGLTKEANQDQIKKAFRKLAKEFHPDKTEGNSELEEKFKEVQEAYEVLSDEDKKTKYDQFGHDFGKMNQQHHGGFGDISELFRRHGFNMGGNPQPIIKRGPTLTINVRVTLEEINTGIYKKLKYHRNDSCDICNGKGGTGEKLCPICNGSGVVTRIIRMANHVMQTQNDCNHCERTGKVIDTICNDCNGSGVKKIEDIVGVEIPAGISDGGTFVAEKKGDSIKNGIAGDLHIIINELPHKNFYRMGNDLRYNLKLTYPQFVLGDKVEIPTIEGKNIRISVPEFSNINDNLRVTNKGLKIMNTENNGDLIIVLDISMPKEINSEEKKLITKLKEINHKIKTV